MKAQLYFLLFIAIAAFSSCSGCGEKKLDKQAYDEQKNNLAIKEKHNPIAFIKLDYDDRKNLFGQTVVKGQIHNIASVVSFKNVRLKLLYYNANKKVIANHEEEYADEIAPGKYLKFKARYRVPKETDSISVTVMSAVPIE